MSPYTKPKAAAIALGAAPISMAGGAVFACTHDPSPTPGSALVQAVPWLNAAHAVIFDMEMIR